MELYSIFLLGRMGLLIDVFQVGNFLIIFVVSPLLVTRSSAMSDYRGMTQVTTYYVKQPNLENTLLLNVCRYHF